MSDVITIARLEFTGVARLKNDWISTLATASFGLGFSNTVW